MRTHRAIAIAVSLAGALAAALAAEPGRVARTLAALDDLERVCQQAERRGDQTLYHRIPLVVERLAMVDLDADIRDRDRVLDHIFESCLRTKVAVLEGYEGRRPRVPPPPNVANARLEGGFCRKDGRIVFPIVADRCPEAAKPFFAQGELRRALPALAGVAPEAFEQSDLGRIYRDDPTSHRVGWDRPAGGFVRDGALVCLDHPAVRDAIAQGLAQALAAWPRDARPLYASLGAEPFYTDSSDPARARFVEWLRDHHKTIRALNTAWGSEHADFGPELMPTPDQAAASAPRWADFVDFNHWRLAEHVRRAATSVRQAVPGVPLGLAPLQYAFAGSYGLSGADPLALAALLDVLEVNSADAMETDLASALAGGARAVVEPALASGSPGILPRQLHGCAAVRLEAWPRAPLTSVEAIREAEQLLRDALDARRLAPQCAALARAPKPIALLYSQASLRLAPQWALRCARSPYTQELARAYQAARFLDVGCTFLTSRDVAQSRWHGVRMLIVPGAPAEEDKVVRALVDYVELGGHLVVIAESLVADDHGREADYLMRLGIEAPETHRPAYSTRTRPDLGGALDDLVATDAQTFELRPAPDGPLAALKRPLRGVGLHEKAQVNVLHKVLATFPDGSPAIATFDRGKGSLTYIAMPLETEDLAAVLRILLARIGPAPPVRLVHLEGSPWGIECRSTRDGATLLAYAWNTTDQRRRVALESGAVAEALDLTTGRPVATRTDKAGTVLGPIRLDPGQAAVFQLTLAAAAPSR